MFWAANMWHTVAGEADRSGESVAHTLNSRGLLGKMQDGDTDPTPLHPASLFFSPFLPWPWFWGSGQNGWVSFLLTPTRPRVGTGVTPAPVG